MVWVIGEVRVQGIPNSVHNGRCCHRWLDA